MMKTNRMKNNYLLKIFVLVFVFAQVEKAVAQYTVSPIPHQAYAPGLSVAFNSDDLYSAVIPLNFDFSFYGNTYNQVVVSTNGSLSFDTTLAGSGAPWAIQVPSIPNASFPVKNSFLGCFHDLYNMDGEGTITYAVEGAAPYRRFVVAYNNNSHFSCGNTRKSSLQMVLYETLNILDSQIIKREVCSGWNSGYAVIGTVNTDGSLATTPPGRNVGPWAALEEGWRFSPGSIGSNRYDFVKCDGNSDGLETFNLAVAQNDLWPANPSGVTFHATEAEAISQLPLLPVNYTNTSNPEVVYANVNGAIYTINLRVVDCAVDFDGDTVDTASEDVNNDTNLANDDTDNDGIPDFIDNDDDGDLILTSEEYVFARNANALLDTDGDGTPNYLDNDDDGDGVLTINEDYNGNNNPADDDTNNNGIPDYLESAVALGVNQNRSQSNSLSLYPNPASNLLNIDNKSGKTISNVAIFTINGALVKQMTGAQIGSAIAVDQLQSGMYFVKITLDGAVENYKFIKK